MAIRETMVIDTTGAEREIKKLEGVVKDSAERQGEAVKEAAAKSTREAIGEYEKAAKEAGRAGKTWADEILGELRASLRTRQAQIKEAFSRGAFDRATMRQMNQDARREFNQGILKALDQMKEKGEANRDEYLKLARALQAVGPAGAKSIEQVERPAGRLRGTISRLVRDTRAWIASFVGLQAIRLATRMVEGLAKASMELDTALTNSLAIMEGVTASMREEMGRQSRLLSIRLNRDAHLVAEGYRFLAAAGLDAEKSLASIGTVSTFASAGQFDLARATDLLTDAQSALGLTVEDTTENLANMTRVADVLTKANTIANATVEQFSVSLTNRAAPALRLVNKDVEEGVAVLAAMADQGVKGEEAGTRLDIVLRDLQNAALRNREAFDRYGVSVFDANGKMRNMADIVADLEHLLDGMSDAQRRATISAMGFQDRSVAALLTLVGTSEGIRDYERALRDAAGTTQEVADRQLQSIEARWGRIGQAWNEARRRASELVVLPVAEWVMEIADAALQFESPMDRAIDQLQRFGTAAEAVMATQLTMRIRDLRDEARQLEEEIRQATAVTSRRQITGRSGLVRTVEETLNIGAMSEVDRVRLRNQLDAQLTDQQERLAQAIADRNTAEEAAAQAAIKLIADQIAALNDLEAKRSELRLVTDQLRDSEDALAEVRPRLELRREIQEIERQIAELNALGVESAAMIETLMQLEARKRELEGRLKGGAEGGETGGVVPADEATLRAGEAAFKGLAAAMREYLLAAELGATSIEAGFPEVRTALQDLLKINNEIEEAEKQIADIRAAGMEVPPGAERYLAHLREQQATLRQIAEEEVERWRIELPEATAEIERSISAVVSYMLPMAGGARTLDVAMRGVANRTRAVAEAERELALAQLTRDPARIAQAERELAEAREELAEFTAQVVAALEAANIPAEEFEKNLARIQEYLEKAGVETKKTEGKFEGLGKKAQTIAGLARGVLSVADAMGILDDQTRRTLEAVVDLGDGITRIVATKGTDIGAWAQSIGSIIQLGASLFGGDPEAAKRAEEMKRSMDRLTDALWELNKSVLRESTRQLERDRELVESGVRAPMGFTPGGVVKPTMEGFAVAMGLAEEGDKKDAAIAALRRWAKEMDERYGTGGILTGFVEAGDTHGFRVALRELLPAIDEQLGKLGSFGDDPAGVINRINFELDVLGETDAAERLRAVAQALKDAGYEAGEFQDALEELASLDLDTPEGRERRDQIVRDMAAALVRGGADLGDLTADQLQDLIRAWAEVSPGPGVSRSVQIGTSITEVQANEVIAWLEDIALTLREIRDGRSMHGPSVASGPAPELATEILEGLHDLVSELATRAQTITPEVIEAVVQHHWDFRGAQFGRLSEQDLDEILHQLRDEFRRRGLGGF